MRSRSARIVAAYREAFRTRTEGWEQGERLRAFLDEAGEVVEVTPDLMDGGPPPEGKFRLAGVPGTVAVPGRLEAGALAAFDPATRTVFLRAEEVTEEFRALLLTHCLLHALDVVSGVWGAMAGAVGEHEGRLRDEVRAYELEMELADHMTEGRFFQALDQLMVDVAGQEDQHFLEEEGPPRLNAQFPPVRSQREGAARLVFFTVAAVSWYADTVAARTKLRFLDEWWSRQGARY